MKYTVEKYKKCTKCRKPMTDFGRFWLCESDGHKINKKVIIGNRLV